MIAIRDIEAYMQTHVHASWAAQGLPVDSSGRRRAQIIHAGRQPSVFVKYSVGSDAGAKMAAEQYVLELFSQIAGVRTPKIYGVITKQNEAALLMESHRQKDPLQHDWIAVGEMVAALHRHSAPAAGFRHDNYIGDFTQKNTPQLSSWNDFYVTNRVEPMLARVISLQLLHSREVARIRQVLTSIDTIAPETTQAFSLLHGDLWPGNVLITDNGILLIDPASSYGNREMDIAFSKIAPHLNFHAAFYDAYNHAFPLPDGYEYRMGLWQLWPLLTHIVQDGRRWVPVLMTAIEKY